MCRTGKVYRQCECGADITCTYESICADCYERFLEDSEVED